MATAGSQCATLPSALMYDSDDEVIAPAFSPFSCVDDDDLLDNIALSRESVEIEETENEHSLDDLLVRLF